MDVPILSQNELVSIRAGVRSAGRHLVWVKQGSSFCVSYTRRGIETYATVWCSSALWFIRTIHWTEHFFLPRVGWYTSSVNWQDWHGVLVNYFYHGHQPTRYTPYIAWCRMVFWAADHNLCIECSLTYPVNTWLRHHSYADVHSPFVYGWGLEMYPLVV
jgi:hypothetical protein